MMNPIERIHLTQVLATLRGTPVHTLFPEVYAELLATAIQGDVPRWLEAARFLGGVVGNALYEGQAPSAILLANVIDALKLATPKDLALDRVIERLETALSEYQTAMDAKRDQDPSRA